jgi:hypothetical protein
LDSAPIVADRPAATKRPPGPKRRLRSLESLDRRTAAAKAAFGLRDEIITDLGGDAHLTSMQRALIHHVAVLGASLGDLAAQYLSGEDVDMTRYATLANAQRRLLADLGLERRAIDVQQHLSTYLAAKRGQPSNDIQQDDGPEEMDPAP